MLDDINKFPDINLSRPNLGNSSSNKKPIAENLKKIKIFNTAVENFYTDSNTSTKDFFLRKTENNFIKKTIYYVKKNSAKRYSHNSEFSDDNFLNLIKDDIINIDEMIKNYANDKRVIEVRRNFQSNPHFHNKLNEIKLESKIEIKSFFKEIEENSKTLENLYKEFKCDTDEELIFRLSTELYYNRLYINKIDNLTFLLNLIHNKTNSEKLNYQFY